MTTARTTWALVGLTLMALLTALAVQPARPTMHRMSSSLTRGVFRYSSTDWARMSADGFTATTDYDAGSPTGMVWVPAFDSNSCTQAVSDDQLTTTVLAHPAGLTYQLGDEPMTNGCANAPDVYRHMTQVVHAADPSAKTFVADDQWSSFNNPIPNHNPFTGSIPMAGSVDTLAFDIYPCHGAAACDFSDIQRAAQLVPQQIGSQNWQFIVQDFADSTYRWPTVAELQQEMDSWAPARSSAHPPTGYWVYAWDWSGAILVDQPGHEEFWRTFNAAATPTPTPTATPTATPTPTPSATPTPTPTPTSTPTPTPTPKAPQVIDKQPCVVNGVPGLCTGAFEPR